MMCCSQLASCSNTRRMRQRPQPIQLSSRSARQRTVVSSSAAGLEGEEIRRYGRHRRAMRLRRAGQTLNGQGSWRSEKRPVVLRTQTRNGPGGRRGRDAAIRLLQGNARAGQYHGPPALLPAISPEWVISLAIDRSSLNELLRPGERLSPGESMGHRVTTTEQGAFLTT
jgi:hypothetical protein